MRRIALVAAVLAVVTCTGERRAQDRPASALAADSTAADSVPVRGDSMMARDTAAP